MVNYNQIYCNECHKITDHLEKLSAVLGGYRVCNECSVMNPVCILTKDGAPRFKKESDAVIWLEFNDDGTFKEKFNEPKVGRSLLMSPFNDFFTWQTTPIIEIIEETINGDTKVIKFKTQNSIYKLLIHNS